MWTALGVMLLIILAPDFIRCLFGTKNVFFSNWDAWNNRHHGTNNTDKKSVTSDISFDHSVNLKEDLKDDTKDKGTTNT